MLRMELTRRDFGCMVHVVVFYIYLREKNMMNANESE